MKRRVLLVVAFLSLAIGVSPALTQQSSAGDMVARIRTEGLQRSRALASYRTLTDEIGARLTGSPAHKQAALWARDRFAEWGLTNPHLEPWEFGRGWQLEHISVEMTEPRYFPLVAYGEAWSPSTNGVVSERAVYVGDKDASQIRRSPTARGAIVLTHLPLTELVDHDPQQPGLDDRPGRDGQPDAPRREEHDAEQRIDAAARPGGCRRSAEAERVPGWHCRRHRQSRHSQ